MEFGSRIKEKRGQLGYSQKEVAEALYVTRQTISKWETGKSYPDLEMLVSLCDLFEISADSLLKEDEKLMEYTGLNPQATKKQKILQAILFEIVFIIMIVGGIYGIKRNKFPELNWLLAVFTLISSVIFIIDIAKIIKIIRKKENPAARMKRLKSPAHQLENRRIASFGGIIVSWIASEVCLQYSNFFGGFFFLALEAFSAGLTIYYSVRIHKKLGLRMKKTRDLSRNKKIGLGVALVLEVVLIVYLVYWFTHRIL